MGFFYSISIVSDIGSEKTLLAFFFLGKRANKNLSLSPDLHVAAHVRSGEAVPALLQTWSHSALAAWLKTVTLASALSRTEHFWILYIQQVSFTDPLGYSGLLGANIK